jgi:N-acylneuraminate cytidylyltransferase
MIALIPARAGSKRVPMKNVRRLGGYPLLVYSIAAAYQSGVFERVCVATDVPDIMDYIGGLFSEDTLRVYHRLPVEDKQPDIAWVRDVMAINPLVESFAILRPTSPFRTAATIRRAYKAFNGLGEDCSSIRGGVRSDAL